ncbi:hypothetical protein ACFLRC_03200 [Candidatus Altiarchaeota archaeon]
MKRISLIFPLIFLISAILVLGCIGESGQVIDEEIQGTEVKDTSPTIDQEADFVKGEGENLNDILKSGGDHECDAILIQDGEEIAVNLKLSGGNKIREEMEYQGQHYVVIFDESQMTSYSEETGEGFIMEIPKEDGGAPKTDELTGEEKPSFTLDDFQNNTITFDCREAAFTEETFEPPADIELTNMSLLIEEIEQTFGVQDFEGQDVIDEEKLGEAICGICQVLSDGKEKEQCLKDCRR